MKKRKRRKHNRAHKRKDKKTRINKQKLFSFGSFIFVLICIFWYGGRAIYYYLDSKKTLEKEANTLATRIISNNNGTIKKINSDYYFYKETNNNYLIYSNIVWRIVKITKDNNIVLITDDTITNLAFGKNKKYNNSYLTKWLNKDNDKYTGIMENNLNSIKKYLIKTSTCTDNITNIKKTTCNKINKKNYLSIPSITDYINTGAEKSFINNGHYTYLANNKNKKIWYIDTDGKLNTSNGEDIYGTKITITLKSKVPVIDGDGTIDKPYTIEKQSNYFATYVKLGEDIWRVYEDNNEHLKLVLNDYIKINDEELKHIYSNDNYYHNDTVYGSLAYYLNNTYFYKLPYYDLIIENSYNNSYYGTDNNFDYSSVLNTSIKTRVGLLSIGDPIINNRLDKYFILAGPNKEDIDIYIASNESTLETTTAQDEALVVPTITINKNSLTAGKGTNNDPYRTE